MGNLINCDECIYCNKCKKPKHGMPVCWVKRDYERSIKLSCIPKRYLTINPDRTEFHKDVNYYLNNSIKGVDKGVGLYLQSAKTGTGKTTAACEILKQYIYDSVWESAHGRPLPQLPGYFVNMADFKVAFNEQYRGSEYLKMKEKMRIADLLVIDDLNSGTPTDKILEDLFTVINERYNENKPVIYTCNISKTDVINVVGERIQSRLFDCREVLFTGIDHRKGR